MFDVSKHRLDVTIEDHDAGIPGIHGCLIDWKVRNQLPNGFLGYCTTEIANHLDLMFPI